MAQARGTAPAAERVCSFPGEAQQVSAVRQFVARELAGCPGRESLLACVSELAANAVEHTDSGDGGSFTVLVGRPRDGLAFVAVYDEGGSEEPAVGTMSSEDGLSGEAGGFAESGRGLAIVAAFSSRWGARRTAHGHVVWATSTWPVPVRGPGGERGDTADLCGNPWNNQMQPRGVA